ncbi:hypothetical protein E8D34_14635 [Nocardioides sp. GY 10113]|uniref:maltokinase N-terminal cap-like domain-containing protein n=1 Tax=Nocardioides sp. GY 10113 TaxID=2569761 RepID=UPI0010A89CCD|nr:hypothetical protein [Nocardioides sp. GY 10113]TIC79743.1 hypothetical protein E8D34_19745 [Nocardioides sp. GY 10113]TIC84929.1 hypothetical protein E8D34_14635 [Nocardioides sp. GY 10113]
MSDHIRADLHTFLDRARWFGGKGRGFEVSHVRRLLITDPVPEGPRIAVDLATVTYEDGTSEQYQVPLSLYDVPQEQLGHATVGVWDDPDCAGGTVFAYDAVHDRAAMARVLAAFVPGSAPGDDTEGLVFVRLAGHDLDLTAPASLFTGEQSNSSVLFGEDAVLKLFRKVTPGSNPDIATHRVLTEVGSTHVAELYGWVEFREEAEPPEGPLQLGMLQQFLRTATDGWDLALTSVRNLFAEADLHADEVGGDFAAEAARLGIALADIHAELRDAFGTGTVPGDEVSAGMLARLEAALEVVPELAPHATPLRAALRAVADVAEIEVQRVHGDLHLGQTLRTTLAWKVVDFEGEPAKPLAERLRPDSRWRDVAGMLRSFDYAAHALLASSTDDDPDVLAQLGRRAWEWAARNQEAFLAAYVGADAEAGAEVRDLTAAEHTLLTAYVLDKAVYECAYEARNRPLWLPIPLGAVERMT